MAERGTRAPGFGSALNVQLFFLGAGFMLVETESGGHDGPAVRQHLGRELSGVLCCAGDDPARQSLDAPVSSLRACGPTTRVCL